MIKITGRIFTGGMILASIYVLGVYGWIASSVATGKGLPTPPIPPTTLFFVLVVVSFFVLDLLHTFLVERIIKKGDELM